MSEREDSEENIQRFDEDSAVKLQTEFYRVTPLDAEIDAGGNERESLKDQRIYAVGGEELKSDDLEYKSNDIDIDGEEESHVEDSRKAEEYEDSTEELEGKFEHEDEEGRSLQGNIQKEGYNLPNGDLDALEEVQNAPDERNSPMEHGTQNNVSNREPVFEEKEIDGNEPVQTDKEFGGEETETEEKSERKESEVEGKCLEENERKESGLDDEGKLGARSFSFSKKTGEDNTVRDQCIVFTLRELDTMTELKVSEIVYFFEDLPSNKEYFETFASFKKYIATFGLSLDKDELRTLKTFLVQSGKVKHELFTSILQECIKRGMQKPRRQSSISNLSRMAGPSDTRASIDHSQAAVFWIEKSPSTSSLSLTRPKTPNVLRRSSSRSIAPQDPADISGCSTASLTSRQSSTQTRSRPPPMVEEASRDAVRSEVVEVKRRLSKGNDKSALKESDVQEQKSSSPPPLEEKQANDPFETVCKELGRTPFLDMKKMKKIDKKLDEMDFNSSTPSYLEGHLNRLEQSIEDAKVSRYEKYQDRSKTQTLCKGPLIPKRTRTPSRNKRDDRRPRTVDLVEAVYQECSSYIMKEEMSIPNEEQKPAVKKKDCAAIYQAPVFGVRYRPKRQIELNDRWWGK